MPFPNEHAARQADPRMFQKMRRGPIPGAPAGIDAIYGINEDGSSMVQSIRAAADKFSPDEFTAWLKENEMKTEIEEATGEDLGEKEEYMDDEEYVSGYSEVYSGVCYLLTHGAVSWVEIVRSGRFFGNTGPNPRKVELSEDDILAMASTYKQVLSEGWFNGGAPVGYNHAQAMGDRTPEATRAAARIQQVEVRPNDQDGLSLWGLFTWTDEGAQRVGAQEFSSISAELIPPAAATSKLSGEKMGGWTLVGATLTNSPFIPQMRRPNISDSLAASETPHRIMLSEETAPETTETTKMSDIIIKLAEATGLPAEAPELLSAVRHLQAEAGKVEALTETLETATKEIEQLRSRKDELEASEKVRLLDDACSVGRIAPTEREDYWQIIGTVGEETAQRMFAEGRVPVSKDSNEAAPVDAPTDNHDAFIALMDNALNEGKSSQEAWNIAAAAHGSTIYTEEN
jgi:hypothetical protein